jgi:hypothetical protein
MSSNSAMQRFTDSIVWVENTFVKGEKFKLPGRKLCLKTKSAGVILVDAMECPIKNNVGAFLEKKKRVIKPQVAVNKKTEELICIDEDCGKTRDFKLYKDAVGSRILDKIKARMDSGCQGAAGIRANSETAREKPKDGGLAKEEKSENRRVSRGRTLTEHINAKIKAFKIMANKRRNRRKRHKLRANLICGIINFETRI